MVIEIIIMLAIGAIAGWLAGSIMKGGGFGLVGNIIVGLIGAVVGTLLGGLLSAGLSMSVSGLIGTIIWATLGAVLLLFVIKLVKKF